MATHNFAQHQLTHLGICYECGCPQYAAKILDLGCPVNDSQWQKMWDDLDKFDKHILNSTRPLCIEARDQAIERRRKEAEEEALRKAEERQRLRKAAQSGDTGNHG